MGTIALIFPVYDSCRRLYDGCKRMRLFSKEIQLLSFELDSHWVTLDGLVSIRRSNLEDPPDADDRDHRVTAAIIGELTILKTHFEKCNEIVENQLSRYSKAVDV